MTPLNRAYWIAHAADYPYHAEAPTLEPGPGAMALSQLPRQKGFGGWVAIPAGDGLTWWGFEHEASRDAFLAAYPEANLIGVEAVFANL